MITKEDLKRYFIKKPVKYKKNNQSSTLSDHTEEEKKDGLND